MFLFFYKSLQNDDGHIKKEITIEVIVHKIKKNVTFTQKNSATVIDNICIDVSKMGNCSICPVINGLSDHDAQSITLHSFNWRPPTKKYILISKINEHTINDLLIKLSYKTWNTIFSTDDVNKMC